MTHKDDTPKRPAAGQTREDRLKAALKANMARRKAQARARSSGDSTEQTNTTTGSDRHKG